MRIELSCPDCACHFSAAAQAPAAEVLDRMTEEGPWLALGDGDTFEDMLVTALMTRGRIRCPECDRALTVSGTSLGWLGDRKGSRASRGGRVPQLA